MCKVHPLEGGLTYVKGFVTVLNVSCKDRTMQLHTLGDYLLCELELKSDWTLIDLREFVSQS